MAVTKILARKGRLDAGVSYVLNGDKTEDRILTDSINCDPGREARQMMETKRELGKEDGVQYYHMIQSFAPGEVTPAGRSSTGIRSSPYSFCSTAFSNAPSRLSTPT